MLNRRDFLLGAGALLTSSGVSFAHEWSPKLKPIYERSALHSVAIRLGRSLLPLANASCTWSRIVVMQHATESGLVALD